MHGVRWFLLLLLLVLLSLLLRPLLTNNQMRILRLVIEKCRGRGGPCQIEHGGYVNDPFDHLGVKAINCARKSTNLLQRPAQVIVTVLPRDTNRGRPCKTSLECSCSHQPCRQGHIHAFLVLVSRSLSARVLLFRFNGPAGATHDARGTHARKKTTTRAREHGQARDRRTGHRGDRLRARRRRGLPGVRHQVQRGEGLDSDRFG